LLGRQLALEGSETGSPGCRSRGRMQGRRGVLRRDFQAAGAAASGAWEGDRKRRTGARLAPYCSGAHGSYPQASATEFPTFRRRLRGRGAPRE
jgi:hypothetical protein